MSRIFAIATSDPSLMCCEVERAKGMVELDDEAQVLGLGAYDDGQLVQRSFGVGVTRSGVWELPSCETALYVAGPSAGRPLDEVAQPFRMRQWLFGLGGSAPENDGLSERLAEQLPDFLQKSLKTNGLEEAVFATFLAELRSLGRTEDPELEAPLAAQLLGRTAQIVCDAAGPNRRPSFSFAATNGRILVATTRGGQSLFYRLLEGDGVCARCGLVGEEKPTTALARDHRRRRSVLIATDPLKIEGWQPVPEGRSVAVGRGLSLQLV